MLAQIAEHNFTCLQQRNIDIKALSTEDFLSLNRQNYDLVYIDPDRRPRDDRVTGFNESKPDLLSMLPDLHKISANILVKASPMMDITLGINELSHVKMVIVLAVKNEVKELLFWLSAQEDEAKIRCINIRRDGQQVLEYNVTGEQQEFCAYDKVAKYL